MLTWAVGAAPTLPYDLFWIVWLAITVGGISIVVFQTRHSGPRRWLIFVPVAASSVLLFTTALIAGDCQSLGPVGKYYSGRCSEGHAAVGYVVLAGSVVAVTGVIIYLMYRNAVAPPAETDE
jgi:hypothetical protein